VSMPRSRRREAADSVVMKNVTIHPLTGGGYVPRGGQRFMGSRHHSTGWMEPVGHESRIPSTSTFPFQRARTKQ